MKNKVLLITEVISQQDLDEIRENLREWQVVTDSRKFDDFKEESSRVVCLVTNHDVDGAHFGFGSDYNGSAKYVALDGEAVTDKFLDLVWARHHKKPLEIAETERLIVREMATDDIEAMYELYAYPGMTEYVEPLYEYEEELEFTRDYIENMYGFYGYGLWLVFRKKDGVLVGRAGLENRVIDGETQVELGYMIGSPFWHNGYAKECCKAIIDYAFSEEGPALERLALCARSDNAASIGLALKLGFSLYAENLSEGMNLYFLTKK